MHLIDQELNCMLRGQFEQGWQISEQLQAMGPDGIPDPSGQKNPEMWVRHSFNRGWFLLQQGDFQGGCQLLESGRFLNVYGSGHLKTDKPIWHGEDLAGKTVILSLEGGYGDEIIHARFATSLHRLGAKVLIAADPLLHSIFSRIQGVDKVITRAEAMENPHDFWVPGFSAGWLCGHNYEDLPGDPYLTPIDSSVEIWKSVINSDKIKVGIRWSGNPKFEHQQFRNFPAEFLINLSKYKDLQLYSLQRDNDTRELPENIIDLQYLMISWEDTAAAIANLDLVITSCTSVAHLAAALGKPTWVLTPILPYHTWAYRAPENTKSPWYKSVRLYRQQKFADWTGTFNQLYQDIKDEYTLSDDALTVDITQPTIETLEQTRIDQSETRPMELHTTNIMNLKKPLFFMAGLPNSGSSIIAKTLNQNPKLHCANQSGLYELFSSILQSWNKQRIAGTEQNKADVLAAVLLAYNQRNPADCIIDKNLSWVTKILQVEAVLGRPVKIICPVRNPAEILSAYEIERKNKILTPSAADDSLGDTGTIASRCFYYSKPTGELGLAHAQLLDAATLGLGDRLLFVDYNKFCNEPQKQLRRIYEFLELDHYEQHDVSGIKRDLITPVEIIGFDLYQQYNAQIFWQNWI